MNHPSTLPFSPLRAGCRLASVLALLLLPQCQNTEDEPSPKNTPESTTTAKQLPPKREQPAVATVTPPPPEPPPPPGEWMGETIYKLRVGAVTPCDPEPEDGATNPSSAAESPGAKSVPSSEPAAAPSQSVRPVKPGAGNRYRVGVSIEVEALGDNVFMTPKGATLEKDGVVIQGELKAEPGEDCKKPLRPTKLRRGEKKKGLVVFKVPNEEFVLSSTFAFKPPRWGGAPRLEVKLPDCLTNCPEPEAIETEPTKGKPGKPKPPASKGQSAPEKAIVSKEKSGTSPKPDDKQP